VVLLSHRQATCLLPRLDDTTLAATAADLKAVLVIKGDTDRITGPGSGATRPPTDGAVQLTKSGTGDVLAGTVGGLLAHGLPPIRAAELGCWLIQAASSRARDRHGPGFLPTELADQLSTVLLPAEGPR
jgi:NAD(P)H-hydrate repair Nnr-like enzyme with NAD(P)H-hydrate dehydratase domain